MVQAKSMNHPEQKVIEGALSGLSAKNRDVRAEVMALPIAAWPDYAQPIVRAALELETAQQPVRFETVQQRLLDAKVTSDRTWEALQALAYLVPTMVSYGLDQIRSRYDRQRAIVAVRAAIAGLEDLDLDLTDTIGTLTQGLASIAERTTTGGPMDMRKAVGTLLDHIERQPDRTMESGIPALADMLGEYLPGNLYVIAARPGMGKTALMVSEALSMADRGVPVYLHMLELPAAESVARMMASRYGLNAGAILRRDAREVRKAIEVAEGMIDLPVWIDDTPSVTVETIQRQARMLCDRGQCRAVFVDYIQLIKATDHRAPREQQIAHASIQLKAISKECGIPVILCAQLNRESEKRKSGEPTMADLRESGQIEQDASVIMFPHRHKQAGDDKAAADRADIIVAKNRHGATGRVRVRWDGPSTRYMPDDTPPPQRHGYAPPPPRGPAPPMPAPDYE
jgi:replicative DNA helicase